MDDLFACLFAEEGEGGNLPKCVGSVWDSFFF